MAMGIGHHGFEVQRSSLRGLNGSNSSAWPRRSRLKWELVIEDSKWKLVCCVGQWERELQNCYLVMLKF